MGPPCWLQVLRHVTWALVLGLGCAKSGLLCAYAEHKQCSSSPP